MELIKNFNEYISDKNGDSYISFLNIIKDIDLRKSTKKELEQRQRLCHASIEKFIEFNTLFFERINAESNHSVRATLIKYYEATSLYISRIRILYLDPINVRINELNNQESLDKAKSSIKLGKISVIGAIISIIMSIAVTIYSFCSNQQLEENITKEFVSIKTKINNLDIQIKDISNKIVIPKLDSKQKHISENLNTSYRAQKP